MMVYFNHQLKVVDLLVIYITNEEEILMKKIAQMDSYSWQIHHLRDHQKTNRYIIYVIIKKQTHHNIVII
jgi:hypothetical protein